MTSIRVYLLVSLLSTITLVNFLSAVHGYRSSMEEAEKLFDSKLAATAELLASVPLDTDVAVAATASDKHTAFQILSASGSLLWRSETAPATVMAPLQSGYDNHNFNGFRWRTLAIFSEARQHWVLVAERSDTRYLLAEKIILESVLPVVLALPLAGLLIWLIIGSGLKSLKQLASELRFKRADDLSSLALQNPPQELEPVLDSTNSLLARLSASFDRERRFSSDAAHELRTPISALKLHVHNLRQQMPGDNLSLSNLEQDVERMAHLVEQILALYRTTPDHYPAQFETIDLYTLAREQVAANYALFAERKQTIELQGQPATISGDRFALGILLQNLLSNANKYTPEGGQIELGVEQKADSVLLTVNDSGPGISADQRSRVFERFYRVGGDRHSSGATGCGLGLSIVNHIALLHQARITLGESPLNHGLSVKLSFPKTVVPEIAKGVGS